MAQRDEARAVGLRPRDGHRRPHTGAGGLRLQLAAQRALDVRHEARNAALSADVVDLQHGYAAIEERARYELGMIKQGEIFYQRADRPARPAKAAH